jgi:hypothetical protein
MVDVHPFHGAARTWTDFFIHIATISVGLLIAIGLEQTVELFHHRQQRQQLEADLRAEGLRNRAIVERDIAYLDAFGDWNLRANRAVQAAQGKPSGPYPERLDQDPLARKNLRYVATTASVWTTARENGGIALLPRDEALVYTRLYRVHDLIVNMDFEWRKAGIAVSGIQSRFSPNPGVAPPDLAAMSGAELDELSALVMQDYAVGSSLKSLLKAFRGANEAVLNGMRSEEDMVEAIYREQLNLSGAVSKESAAVSSAPSR